MVCKSAREAFCTAGSATLTTVPSINAMSDPVMGCIAEAMLAPEVSLGCLN